MEPTIRTHPMITRSITRELQEQDAEADFVRNAMAGLNGYFSQFRPWGSCQYYT